MERWYTRLGINNNLLFIMPLLKLFVLMFFILPSTVFAASNIVVEGTNRIDKATVVSYASPYLSKGYSDSNASEATKALFATGFFADVKITAAGDKVKVIVQENPVISKLAFEGNRKVKDKDLRKEVFLLERSIYSLSRLKRDVQRISQLYNRKGYRNVKVDPKLITIDNNKVNLVYEIVEGKPSRIKQITFAGNKAYSNSKLQSVITSSESKWWHFFSSADVYDPDKTLYDQEQLRQFYMQNGYADFSVLTTSAELSNKKDAYLLTYTIHEGDVYKYGDLQIDSKIKDVDPATLYTLLQLKKGAIFNLSEVEEAVDRLTDYLGQHGYVFVDVDTDYKKNNEQLSVDVIFSIQEAPRVYVNKINIRNNTRTQDRVIRREMRLHEGDPYNATKMQRSRQRVQNLGYFSNVDMKNVRTDQIDKVDVDIEVEETSTGSIKFGIGYNTATGPLGSITLTENNFLGKGQSVSLGLEKSGRSHEASFTFVEPYFMDRNLMVGFELSTSRFQGAEKNKLAADNSKISYNSNKHSLSLFMGYDLTEYLYHSLHYMIQKEKLGSVSEKANDFVRNQKRNTLLSLVGHSLTYDKRDNRLDPRSGYMISASQDIAGLGGDKKYIKHAANANWHIPLYKKEVVINLRAKAGNITAIAGKKVGVSDGFLLGPDGFIRGFDYGGVGPRDKKTDDSITAKNFYSTNIELTFPLGLGKEYGLRGEVFVDAASAFGTDASNEQKVDILDKKSLRASWGAGIVWNTAMFGNIEIAYAKAFRKEQFDKQEKLVLNFAKSF